MSLARRITIFRAYFLPNRGCLCFFVQINDRFLKPRRFFSLFWKASHLTPCEYFMQGRGSVACSMKHPFCSQMWLSKSAFKKSKICVCIHLFCVECYDLKWAVKKPVSGMMDAVFFGAVILQVLTSALCYPNGAPPSTCVDMMPRHGGIAPQPNPAPYTIQPNSTTFQTGTPITGKGPFEANTTGSLLF